MITTRAINLKGRLLATFIAVTACANGVLAAEIADDAHMQARSLLSGTAHSATELTGVSGANHESISLDPQEQARRFIVGTPSVGIGSAEEGAIARRMPINSDARNDDVHEMARRMLTGHGA